MLEWQITNFILQAVGLEGFEGDEQGLNMRAVLCGIIYPCLLYTSWLGGDHYKWRAMRTNGVDERFCTGKDTTDWEKFEKWAETVPYTCLLYTSRCV